MKDLLRMADLSPDDLLHLLFLADDARRRPGGHEELLRGQSVVMYFAKPSTRTRLSFAAAVARMGGVPQVIGPDELQLGRGETIEDTARVISRYARALVVRTYGHEDASRFAAAASVPVINGLSDSHHPCQALADLSTLRRRFGRLAGLRLAYVGDGNNVAHSLLEACALAGVHITVATPAGYEPDPEVVATAERLASAAQSDVAVVRDPHVAVRRADAVYTDVWLSMGDSEHERAARTEAFRPYRVDEALMAEASGGAVFMHCLPAHRGEEVTAAVIDGPRSLVFEQAEDRMHTAHALLFALALDQLDGHRSYAGIV